jgi:hypothetical protein
MKFVDMILMIYNMISHKKERFLYLYWSTIQFFSYLFYILSALYVVGFIKENYAHIYLSRIDNIAKVIVSLFLMWKFNMFRTNLYFSELDRSIVFQCALFLFLTTSFNEIIINNLINVKNKVINKNEISDFTKRLDETIGNVI